MLNRKDSGHKRKLGSYSFTTTQPGIIATIYLSPIALLKNKTPYIFVTCSAFAAGCIIIIAKLKVGGKINRGWQNDPVGKFSAKSTTNIGL